MPKTKTKTCLGFIGAGNMTSAMVAGFELSGTKHSPTIICSDHRKSNRDFFAKRFGTKISPKNGDVARHADVLFLSVKPQAYPKVLHDLKNVDLTGKTVMSLAAGFSLDHLRRHIQQDCDLVRIMPNLAVSVGEGALALSFDKAISAKRQKAALDLLRPLGNIIEVDEELLDAVTGLSGSGPAYIAMIVESLADGGVKMGLSRKQAQALAAQTLLGSAKMLISSHDHPGTLKDRVASPGGTAIAGIHTLERGGLRDCLINAVEAATLRSKALNT